MFHNVVYLAHAIAPPWFALYSKITGVDKGGPGGPGPPNGRAKKINAMFTSERRY